MKRILIFLLLSLLCACGEQQTSDETVDYPERKHDDAPAHLALTKHQLEHIEFAVEMAEIKTVAVPLSLPGRIALNERATAHITARVTGRVEKVHRVIGDRIKQGDAVVELFSQEFLTMQSEFIQAEERFKRMASEQPDYGTARAIHESARKKLEVVGLNEAEIDALADKHVPLTLLPVRAPLSGTLLMGEVRLGEFVEIGREFFTIADLRNLWVIADVFEHDLPLISEGLTGAVRVTPYPAETFAAKLTRIYDMVDEKSRTIKVRFEVANAREKLKPEMFATVNIDARFGGSSLKVPSSAVMQERGGSYVFVALNDTTFAQRPVQIGFETKAYTEILSGLQEREIVVAKGTFYLKSEAAKATFVEEE